MRSIWKEMGIYVRDAPLIERFNASYIPEPNSGCWLWDGAYLPLKAPRPVIRASGRRQPAHRVAYELFVGPIPVGAHICHHCDVSLCVNPKHLYAGTHKTNMRDMVVRGRNATTRLTAQQARDIRRDTRSGAEVAAEYGVTTTTISEVRRGLTWRHLDPSTEWAGRQRGEAHPRAKLTAAQVIEIFHSTRSSAELGREFGVNSAHIRRIRCRKTWQHVTQGEFAASFRPAATLDARLWAGADELTEEFTK